MRSKGKIGSKFGAMVQANSGLYVPSKPRGFWTMSCLRDGEEIWREEWENLVVNAGLTYLIGAGLISVTQITTWYIGLVNGASPTFAAADTMASHGGWTENTNYDEANRVTWQGAAGAAGVTTNAGNVGVFTMSSSVTIGGAFLTSNNTKGGTTGTLYAAGDFAVDRSVVDNDVLQVTAVFSVVDDGV